MSRNKHIYSLETLFRMAHDVKKNGNKVVLTHGAFDLFHIGHLHLIKQSAKKGDFFIVGVESDKSIRAYKNITRPIMNENSRMNIISELNSVDGVFILDYEELGGRKGYINLYKELKVDYLTIGRRNFAEENIREDLAQVKGTKLVKIDDDFESTTNIIKRAYDSFVANE